MSFLYCRIFVFDAGGGRPNRSDGGQAQNEFEIDVNFQINLINFTLGLSDTIFPLIFDQVI